MAGHSKWKQIKHKKGAADAKRGQLFSKLVREIMVAVRTGGSNPSTNTRLKVALERARASGLPKENSDRAIARASGTGDGVELIEALYGAIGPGGIAILIETITDNKNRTLAEMKNILNEFGGKFVEPASVLWNFEKVETPYGYDYRARSPIAISDESKTALETLLTKLSEHDDVQKVYTNISDERSA